ncbi:plasmid pRiA4b ORF-3 family protein [Micromonospora sp. M12]
MTLGVRRRIRRRGRAGLPPAGGAAASTDPYAARADAPTGRAPRRHSSAHPRSAGDDDPACRAGAADPDPRRTAYGRAEATGEAEEIRPGRAHLPAQGGSAGAKPPIWRRLELPADTSLADLHHIIQVAFGWHDSHLHVFETAYGDFGVADRELGHRAEAPVTLEQVASGVGDRLRYTYDFGDDWAHDIVVEHVLPRQPIAYPRCTGGRRAALRRTAAASGAMPNLSRC